MKNEHDKGAKMLNIDMEKLDGQYKRMIAKALQKRMAEGRHCRTALGAWTTTGGRPRAEGSRCRSAMDTRTARCPRT